MTIALAPSRLPDWEARLHALILDRRDRAFEWGSNDCALWGADVVAALTGEDFGAPFRGTYTDAPGAAEALRLYGAGTIVRTFDAHLRRTARSFAARGDLVKAHGSIGVVYDADALFVGREGERDGLVRVPRAAWTLAWRV